MQDCRRIYVIDDNARDRTVLTSFLNNSGFITRPLGSGAAFLANLPDLRPGCVVLKLGLLDRDGIGFIEIIGKRIPRFPVIVVTGQCDVGSVVCAMKLGASDVFEQTIDNQVMLDALSRAFEKLEADLRAQTEHTTAVALLQTLNRRESAVLNGLAAGLSNKVIAHQLQLSVRTVETYRASMMNRLGVRSFPDALRLIFIADAAPHCNMMNFSNSFC